MGATKNAWLAYEQARAEREAAEHGLDIEEWVAYCQDQMALAALDDEEFRRRMSLPVSDAEKAQRAEGS
jgi:hypothetical protein